MDDMDLNSKMFCLIAIGISDCQNIKELYFNNNNIGNFAF